MDLTEEPTAVPGWEAAKENVLPVKKGRSAKGLSEILVRPVSKTLEEEQEHAFEELIHSTASPSEKLELYGRYLKWARDTFPSSTDKIMQILEQGTRELQEHEELKNEPKYVMMWIDYADLVRTPGEVFTYMSTNKLGERVALFWVAWAYVAEKALNYKLTDQIFQKAIRRGAEPKELLNQRYKQFMRRMARLYLNNSTDPGEGTGAAQYTESADRNAVVDNAITQRAMEAIRAQPSVTAAPVAQPAVPGERRALNTLAGHTNTSTPALPVAAHAHPAVTSRSSGSSHSRSSSRAPAPASGVAPRASNVGFEIFSDTPAVGNNASAHSASASAGTSRREVAPHLYEADRDSAAINHAAASAAPAATWKQLGTEAVRRKENDGPVTKWSAGPLFPAAAPGSTTTIPTATTTTTSIPIYVDEEFQVSDSTTSHTTHTATHHAVPDNVLSVRRQLDAADVILKNPLLRHTAALTKDAPLTKEPATDKAESAKVRPALGEVAKTKAPVAAERVEELPVFTSLPHPAVPAVPKGSAGSAAGRGLSVSTSGKSTGSGGMGSGGSTSGGLPFAIFSDTPTNNTSTKSTKNSTTTTISPIKRGAFSVYESPTGSGKITNTTATAKTSTATSTTATGGGMGFAIYSDEPAAANVPAKKVTNTNTATTSSNNKSMGFAIYSDEPAPLPAAPVPAPAAKKASSGTGSSGGGASGTTSKGFTIFADEPAAPPAPVVAVVKKEKPTLGGGSTSVSGSGTGGSSGGGMSFAIYSDDAAPATTVTSSTTTTSTAGAAKKGPSFDIFVDNTTTTATTTTNPTTTTTTSHTTNPTTNTTTTPHTTSTEEEQEAELQGLLDNLLQADGEDGTINTRLARRDIDMMFCSPTIHRHPAVSAGAGSGGSGGGASGGGNVNSSVVHDENAMPFTIRAPPRTPGPSTTSTTTLRALPYEEDEEVFADEFDNDYSESTHPHHTTTRNTNYTTANTTAGDKVVYHSSASTSGTSGRHQQQRAFGAHLDTFSAVKDLSAIKESSQEFSMCGMMLETPGHTNTLGFGAHGRQHYSSGNNNNRASYSTMGGLMDFDISHSRDSIGSVHQQHPAAAPPACSTQGGARGGGGGGSLGFAIFQDDTPVKVKSGGSESESENAHKRKEPSGSAGASNSSQQEPYLGV